MTHRRHSSGSDMRLRHHRVAAENLGRYWSGIDVSPKATFTTDAPGSSETWRKLF